MLPTALADKLLYLCEHNATTIADRWYADLERNPRTQSFASLDRRELIRMATAIYRNLKQAYFHGDPYHGVTTIVERMQIAQKCLKAGIPIDELIYAMILMRRHIWLYAELQALFMDTSDFYQAINSINRILLLFDYAMYYLAQSYVTTDSPWGSQSNSK